jgi:hypothetical protein
MEATRPKPQHRERLINRRVQGDLGEFSAMEWLVSKGALVWIPLGHSPDVDLMAEIDGRVLRVQVKTSTYRLRTSEGDERWEVSIATNGGNQSWTGNVKKFDPTRVDYLFALVGDGRRWMIPSQAIESQRAVMLGAPKYSEFEVERGQTIEHLVYHDAPRVLESNSAGGASESGEPSDSVKVVPMAEWVRIPPPPSSPQEPASGSESSAPLRFQRTSISVKHQITIPSVAFRGADLQVGDRLHARADGLGRVVLERVGDAATLPERPGALPSPR